MDATAEVMQTDGTWLRLRLCSIDTHLDANSLNTATIVVEPSSIDQIALLDSYGVRKVDDTSRVAKSEAWREVIAQLRRHASETLGPNATLAEALETL
jgi:hypothetical protein